MATDLIAKLRLEDREWNNTINKAKSSVKSFESTSKKSFNGASSGADLLGKGLGKISGYVAGAVTAMETFNKVINSNASLQDEYNNTIKGLSSSVDTFFNSLTTGDFTSFENGLISLIKRSKEFQESLANIQKLQITTSTGYDRTDARKNELEAIIEDESRTITERINAQKELDKLLMMGIADIREASTITRKELKNMINYFAGGNAEFVDENNAEKLINQLYNPYSELSKNLKEYANDRSIVSDNLGNSLKKADISFYKKQIETKKSFDTKYTQEEQAKYDELLRIQSKLTDETYLQFKEMFDNLNYLIDKSGTWEKDRTGARDEINDALSGSTKSTSSAKNNAEKIFDEGSIAYLQQNINKLKKEFEEAGNDGLRAGLNAAIKEAETQLQMLKLMASKQELISDNTFSNKNNYRNPTADLSSGYVPKIEPISDEATESLNGYQSGLEGIASMLTSVNQLTNEGTASWLNYGANVLSTISNLLTKLPELNAMLATKTVLEGASSAAQTPVVGWITAIGAIASLIAAVSSIPKFATGGIVGGSSLVGDNILVGVNSGEMILNKRQQANLFNLLDGKYTGNSSGNQNVKFTISGKDLVATLNNYNDKAKRY